MCTCKSEYHRKVWIGKDSKTVQFKPTFHREGCHRLDQVARGCIQTQAGFKHFQDEDSTNILDNLFQCLITKCVKISLPLFINSL